MGLDVTIVSCPSCGARVVYALDNPWRPFCSLACRDRDWSHWMTETYRMNESEEEKEEYNGYGNDENLT